LDLLSIGGGTELGVTDAELHLYRNLSDTLIATLRRFNKAQTISRAISERLDLAERALHRYVVACVYDGKEFQR
jgi:hypothetical protein